MRPGSFIGQWLAKRGEFEEMQPINTLVLTDLFMRSDGVSEQVHHEPPLRPNYNSLVPGRVSESLESCTQASGTLELFTLSSSDKYLLRASIRPAHEIEVPPRYLLVTYTGYSTLHYITLQFSRWIKEVLLLLFGPGTCPR